MMVFNPVTHEFLDTSISEFGPFFCFKEGFWSKINNRMANSPDPDETACYTICRDESLII